MSVAFTIEEDGIWTRNGFVHIRGTADFTASGDPGEDIEGTDIDAEVTSITRLHLQQNATHSFQFIKTGKNKGTIKLMTRAGSPPGIAKATAISVSDVPFHLIGQADFS